MKKKFPGGVQPCGLGQSCSTGWNLHNIYFPSEREMSRIWCSFMISHGPFLWFMRLCEIFHQLYNVSQDFMPNKIQNICILIDQRCIFLRSFVSTGIWTDLYIKPYIFSENQKNVLNHHCSGFLHMTKTQRGRDSSYTYENKIHQHQRYETFLLFFNIFSTLYFYKSYK